MRTTVSAGALQIGAGGTTGSIAGNVTDNASLAFNRSDDLGFAGVISGTGSLTKLGAGTLTLTGANTYTGSTTISAGTLQIGNGGTTGSITGNVTDNGALIFNRSDDLGFAGVISGSGSMSKLGTGTLTLTGANTYTGGTTVEAGTLQSGAAGAFVPNTAYTINGGTLDLNDFNLTMSSLSGNGGTLDLGTAALIVNQGTDTSYAGTIVGTGSLAKQGTGMLALTGANTYSGGTTIEAGTLQIGDGGTSGSISGNITDNAALIFNRSDDLSYGGDISGTGSMTKLGTGNLTLTGANTYSGDTNIDAGTLLVNGSIVGDTFVNGGGTLGGAGSLGNVTVNSGGTLSPGNSPGILTVNGDLTLNSGATTIMQIDGMTLGTQYDHIDVTGTATLDGTLDLQFSYLPTIGSTFNLINTGSFVLAGDPVNGFSSIIDNISSNLGAAVQVTPVISATEYDILIQQLSFIDAAGGPLTPNQRRLAGNLDTFSTSGNGATLFGALNMLPAGEIPGALESLSGVQHTHSLPQAANVSRQFMHILGDRLSWEESASNTAANRYSNVQLAYNGENLASLFGAPVKTKPDSNVWLRAMGGFGDIDSDGNASGADYNSSGVALGYDREVRDGLLAGVAFGFTRSNVDVAAGGTDIDSYQLAAYGRKQWENNYLDATLGIGHHRADSTRQVQFNGFSEVARADYNTDGVGLSLEAGRHYALSASNRVTPFAGLEYGHFRQGGYKETGAGDANLTVDDSNMDSLRSVLGARMNNVLTGSEGRQLDTTLGLSWAHEFLDREASLNPAFNVNSNVPFNINGPETDRDRVLATVGASARLSKTAQLDLDYNGEFAESDRQHAITATFRMQW
jgi:outer membrane autotransporter protein